MSVKATAPSGLPGLRASVEAARTELRRWLGGGGERAPRRPADATDPRLRADRLASTVTRQLRRRELAGT